MLQSITVQKTWNLMRQIVSSYQVRFLTSSTVKEKVVVVGSGWGGFRVARDLDKTKYDVTVLSPRNHFLFTPLLPSTCVGTLEFRCVQEPVRTIKGVNYLSAVASEVNLSKKEITFVDLYKYEDNKTGEKYNRARFKLDYDKLVLAVGTKSNTFNVPGIESLEEDIAHSKTGTNKHNVFFLKQLEHARAIRNRIIECFERSSSSFISEAERRRLLTFVVVGGGPTAIEFTSELYDFLKYDVSRWYPDLSDSHSVVLIEAGNHLLGSFDSSLSQYVERLFSKRKIIMKTGQSVARVHRNHVELSTGENLEFGVCVWSTGNTALNFIRDLGFPLSRDGRVLVDTHLQVDGLDGVYALGDCAVDKDKPLAMLAQVANQQGKYLAKTLNKGTMEPFQYRFMGSMAQLGTWKAVVDLDGHTVSGLAAFIAWRSAYWGYQVSVSNKILIPMYWFKSYWFGRDVSKF